MDASSTVFKFSPEEFKRTGIYLNGQFSRGGHVRLLKSSDESVQDVKVNVTLYSGRDDLNKEVKLSAFDNKGQYAVQIERGHFQGRKPPHHKPPHHKPPHKRPDEDEDEDREEEREGQDDDERRQEDCLVYNVDIEFPSNIDYFDDIELHIKAAQRIQGGKGIEGIEFGSVKAGLGRGAIIFDVSYNSCLQVIEMYSDFCIASPGIKSQEITSWRNQWCSYGYLSTQRKFLCRFCSWCYESQHRAHW